MIDRASSQPQDESGTNTCEIAALLTAGRRLYRLGKFQDACRMFEALAVLDGGNPYVHGILGSIYQKQQRLELALLCYNTAIGLLPDDVDSLVNRGELLLKFGEFRKAAEDLARAVQLAPARKNRAARRALLLASIAQEALAFAEHNGVPAPE